MHFLLGGDQHPRPLLARLGVVVQQQLLLRRGGGGVGVGVAVFYKHSFSFWGQISFSGVQNSFRQRCYRREGGRLFVQRLEK